MLTPTRCALAAVFPKEVVFLLLKHCLLLLSFFVEVLWSLFCYSVFCIFLVCSHLDGKERELLFNLFCPPDVL